jgi:hypothetical protein
MDVRKRDYIEQQELPRHQNNDRNNQAISISFLNDIIVSMVSNGGNYTITTNEASNDSQDFNFPEIKQAKFQGKITRTPDNNRRNPYVIPTNRKTNSQTSNSNHNLQFVINPSTSHDSSSSRLVSEDGLSSIATASKKLEQCQIKLHLFFKEIEQNNIKNAVALEAVIINLCKELDEKDKKLCLAKMYLGHSLLCVNSNNSSDLETIIEQINILKKDNISADNPKLSTIFCLDNYLVHVLLLNGNYTEAKDLACEVLDDMNALISFVNKQDQNKQRLILNLTRIYVTTYCLLAVCYHKEKDDLYCQFALEYITEYTAKHFDNNQENRKIIEKTVNSIEQNTTDKLLKHDLINY